MENGGVELTDQNFAIKEESAMRIASQQWKGMPYMETVPAAFNKLKDYLKKNGIEVAEGSNCGLAVYYDDPNTTPPEQVKFMVGLPVGADAEAEAEEGAMIEDVPAQKVAFTTLLGGDFSKLPEIYMALFQYIQKEGLQMAGPPREVYVEFCEETPDEWVTEVQWPVF